MAFKYFLYSSEQLKFKRNMEKKMGRTYVPGTVISGGKQKTFTEMSDKSSLPRFTDSKVVASGETTTMKYTMPKST